MTEFNDPRNEDLNPPTTMAGDKVHVLNRYRIDAIIYAPTRKEAEARLEQARLYLDAGKVVGS